MVRSNLRLKRPCRSSFRAGLFSTPDPGPPTDVFDAYLDGPNAYRPEAKNRTRRFDAVGSNLAMSEGPMAKRTITKLREKIAIAEKRIIGSDRFDVVSQTRPGQVPAQPRESVTVAAEIEDAQIVAPEVKRGFALGYLALHSVKSSPLLASFIGCVLVPAFAATIYFVFLASDQWAAEARFEVRQVDINSRDTSLSNASQTTGQSGSISQSAQSVTNFSFTATGQDAYVVTNYIASRAIVDDLNAKLNLREIFRRPEADFWARLKRNATVEELVDYWKSMVSTYIDAPSGIVTVQVRAFRTDDAMTLANAVLQLSETLVNRISDRARHDAMETAEKEVRRAYEMTQAALADLHRFRDSAGIIDPMQTGTEVAKLLIPLMTEKIRLESDLFVASRNLDDSAPTIKALRSRLQSAEQQIADLRGKLTNTPATTTP